MNLEFAPFLSFRRPRPLDSREIGRVETVLATARAILAISAFIAIRIDPTEPARYYAITDFLLAAYVVYALFIVALLRFRPLFRYQAVLHLADVFWIALLGAFTDGPSSPFFIFFTFMLLAAAYRWGFWETMLTGLLIGMLFVMQTLVLGDFGRITTGELNRLIMRSVYLGLASFLLGFMAEAEKRLREEKTVVLNAMNKARADFGVTHSVQGVLDEICSFYEASRILMVVEELATERVYMADRVAATAADERLHFSEIGSERRGVYLYPVDAAVWRTVWRERNQRCESRGVDAAGAVWAGPIESPSSLFRQWCPFKSLLAVSVLFGDDVSGRLYIVDPQRADGRVQDLLFLQNMTRQVNSAVYNVYLWRRLRAKAGALERARVARELHDGLIQSLIGLEMQLDVLKHQAVAAKGAPPEGIARVQDLLRAEIQNVRTLMNQMRPLTFNPDEMIDFMADVVDKFSRDTSISAKFVADRDDVALPPQVCRELVQILQEALMNVKKHSGAAHVLVMFSSSPGSWDLAIDDDGKGFEFSGSMDQDQLDDQHLGPVVIKERARLIRGSLEVASRPGHGARLNVRLPKHIYG